MRHLKNCLTAFSIYLISISSPAQTLEFQREISPFSVTDQTGSEYDLAFFGGLNSPRMQFFDEDGDGDLDLFVQEAGDAIILLRNVGSSNQALFSWTTDRYQGLSVGAWYRFRDGDQDGDLDLFCESPLSHIRYYRNTGSPGNPIYSLAADTLRDNAGNPLFLERSNIPEFADIDCDGDDDLFVGQLDGSITLYDHLGVDAFDLPVFALNTHRYQDIIITTGQAGGVQPPQKTSERHGANTLSLIDLDGDNDLDFLWGDFFASSLIYLENQGNCGQADVAISLEAFPPETPLSTGGFNVPRFADIDGDGDQDLFAGVLGGAFSTSTDLNENFYFFQNTGGAQSPQYGLTTRRFLHMVDIGDRSTAALVDIDGDTDLDIVMANEQDPVLSGQSRFYLFENRGGPAAPSFVGVTDAIIDVTVGFNLAPVFVDIDDDTDLDLIIGEWNGNLNHFENVGSAGFPQFELRNEAFAGIDVGTYSTPSFVDIDADGDYDLFVGEFLGNLNFLENTGSSQTPTFLLRETQYGQIDVGQNSFPAFADLDGDLDFDLIVGSEDDTLTFFRNDGTPDAPDFVPAPEWTVPAKPHMTPVFGDIEGDGDLDLFAGNLGGGLLFYRNNGAATTVSNLAFDPAPQIRLGQNYPNPFNQSTQISFELDKAQRVSLAVYSLTGTRIRVLADQILASGHHSLYWDGRFDNGAVCPSGIYWVNLTTPDTHSSRKIMLLK